MGNALKGDLGRSFVHGVPAIELILARLPATFELVLLSMTLAMPAACRSPLCRARSRQPPVAHHHGRHAPRLLPAQLLEGHDADPALRRAARLAADRRRGETVSLLGIKTSLLTLDGLKHLALPAINLAIPQMALMIRLVAAGTTETMTQDYTSNMPAPRRAAPPHRRPACAAQHPDPGGDGRRHRVRQPRRLLDITETVFAWPAWASC